MPKQPRWTAIEAERALLASTSSGRGESPDIWKGSLRVTVPVDSGASLHPKIVKQVLETIERGSWRHRDRAIGPHNALAFGDLLPVQLQLAAASPTRFRIARPRAEAILEPLDGVI
jgi:hypothetical protein